MAIVFAARLPGVYSGLWEDEVHYSKPPLVISHLSAIRRETGPLMRPMLGSVVWKTVFSKRSWPVKINERNLHLVPLAISILNLALLFFVPWTESRTARFVAGLLVGLSPVEIRYSTEAQSYSFISLMASVLCFGLYFSLKSLDAWKVKKALLWFFGALFLSANTHFFNLSLLIAVFGVFCIYSWDAPFGKSKLHKLGLLVLLGGAVAVLTGIINKPIIAWMLFFGHDVAPSHQNAFSLASGFKYLVWNWSPGWLAVPKTLFYISAAVALFHPVKRQRFVAGGLLAGITVLKGLMCAAIVYKSSYAIAERHIIMFLAPSAILFALGIDSSLGWMLRGYSKIEIRTPLIKRALPSLPRYVISGLVLIFILQGRAGAMRDVYLKHRVGPALWRVMPSNYSLNHHFFVRVKRLAAPVLVLSNHCWAKDIPEFYLARLSGKSPKGFSAEVFNTTQCETPAEQLKQATNSFFTDHVNDGYFVYFFERTSLSDDGVCGSDVKPIYRQKRAGSCLGIYKAADLQGKLLL